MRSHSRPAMAAAVWLTSGRLLLDDLRQAAVVVASTAYHLAMRDEMMPRKPAPEAMTDR
jgi:hypothetical protein